MKLNLSNIILLGVVGYVAIKLLRKDKSLSSSEESNSSTSSGSYTGNTTDPKELENIRKYGSIYQINVSMTPQQEDLYNKLQPISKQDPLQGIFLSCRKKLRHNIYTMGFTNDRRTSSQLAIDNCITNVIGSISTPYYGSPDKNEINSIKSSPIQK